MPTTTNYAIYTPPLTGVTPDVPRDTKTAADTIDAALKAEETARIAADVSLSSSRTLSNTFTPATGTSTPIPYNSQELNEIPWDSGNNRFTVPTAGYYQINAGLYYNGNGTGIRTLQFLVNGLNVGVCQQPGNASGNGLNLSRLRKLAANDTVQVVTIQTSGGALGTTTSAAYNYVDLTRVSF